jgi:hypothetical protein
MSTGAGINLASYFVNVQTLKVSFLMPNEALHLINHPMPAFPGDDIFTSGVNDEIIRVTGGHPFLIQALCSRLIDVLNVEMRVRAKIQDVKIAMNQVLENWWDGYFRDLWYCTSEDQRTCLAFIVNSTTNNTAQIEQRSGLGTEEFKQALKKLLKRDLV